MLQQDYVRHRVEPSFYAGVKQFSINASFHVVAHAVYLVLFLCVSGVLIVVSMSKADLHLVDKVNVPRQF